MPVVEAPVFHNKLVAVVVAVICTVLPSQIAVSFGRFTAGGMFCVMVTESRVVPQELEACAQKTPDAFTLI